MLKWIRATVAAAAVLSMAACAGGNNNGTAPDNTLGTRNNTGPYTLNRDTGPGRYDMNNWDGRILGNPYTNDNVRGSRLGDHDNTRVDLSQEVADQIAKMRDVDSAYVFLTDRNAYVAVKLDARANEGLRGRTLTRGDNFRATRDNNDISDGLKRRIAAKVKQVHPKVKNVYVSANPGFLQRMQGFADSIDRGMPVRGFIDEFNQVVMNLFPTNAANDGDRNFNNGKLRNRTTGTNRGMTNNFTR